MRPIILVITDYYLPGYESGGALRTLANMVDRLGERYDFRIVTRDHDGRFRREPYTTVNIGEWNAVGAAKVYYLSKENLRMRVFRRLVAEVSPDAIYLNSFFSPFTLYILTLRRLNLIGDLPIVLAPEGEFSKGALALKSVKKRPYVRLTKTLNLLSDLTWKAAADDERKDIEQNFPRAKNIFVAPNMPPKTIFYDYDQTLKPAKSPGTAKMAFLSRFTRKKNFNWLVEQLAGIEGDLVIDVYGTLQEPDYWAECEALVATLPSNVKIKSKGPIPHEQVSDVLAAYHFFVLPTLGENFGHIFIEALASGCPLLTTDRTPWRDLAAKGVGWDLPLEAPDLWIKAVEQCISMSQDEYSKMSAAARDFSVDWLGDPSIESSNIEALEYALGSSTDANKAMPITAI